MRAGEGALPLIPACAGKSGKRPGYPSAAMTSLDFAATFCIAYWMEARCRIGVHRQQQSSGTMTK